MAISLAQCLIALVCQDFGMRPDRRYTGTKLSRFALPCYRSLRNLTQHPQTRTASLLSKQQAKTLGTSLPLAAYSAPSSIRALEV